MDRWLPKLWKIRLIWWPKNLRNSSSMLIMDVFKGQLIDSLKNKLRQKKCDLVIILDNMTSQLQLFKININKSFKDHIKSEYENSCIWKLPIIVSRKIKGKCFTNHIMDIYCLEKCLQWDNNTFFLNILHDKCIKWPRRWHVQK